ncbi:hypothetical protein TNCV_4801531 [Trichonephila clavipes]|nr:hypothetical protein TNCV_4801531 [Trichonephila clavipes]
MTLRDRTAPGSEHVSTHVGYRFIDSRIPAHCIKNVHGIAIVHNCPNMEFSEKENLNLVANSPKKVTYVVTDNDGNLALSTTFRQVSIEPSLLFKEWRCVQILQFFHKLNTTEIHRACPQSSRNDFFVVGSASWRGKTSDGKVCGDIKLRYETSVSRVRTIVVAGSCSTQGHLIQPRRA